MNKPSEGFTLIEGVIAIVLLSIVFAVGGLMLTEGFRAYFFQREATGASISGNIAIERLSRELRTVEQFTTTTASTMSFISTEGYNVTVALSGNQLIFNGQVLASNISSFTISYLTASLAPTTNPNDVFYVTINLAMSRAGTTFPLRTTVFSRN